MVRLVLAAHVKTTSSAKGRATCGTVERDCCPAFEAAALSGSARRASTSGAAAVSNMRLRKLPRHWAGSTVPAQSSSIQSSGHVYIVRVGNDDDALVEGNNDFNLGPALPFCPRCGQLQQPCEGAQGARRTCAEEPHTAEREYGAEKDGKCHQPDAQLAKRAVKAFGAIAVACVTHVDAATTRAPTSNCFAAVRLDRCCGQTPVAAGEIQCRNGCIRLTANSSDRIA
eukprot:5098371-Prymnesium_polylepis.1